jgi:hypothetical protein
MAPQCREYRLETDELPDENDPSGPAVVHGLVYSSNSDNRLPTVGMFEWEPEDDEISRMISSVGSKAPSRVSDHNSIAKSSSEEQAETRKCHDQVTNEHSKWHYTFPLLDCFFDMPCCARH